MTNLPLWGIDLGGTKIEGIIMPSLNNAVPLVRMRVDTEAGKGYDYILQQVDILVKKMQQHSGLVAQTVGFGTPGVLDPVLQTMKNCNTTSLNGKPLKKDLEEILQIPVVLANDANCFALAETHWGIAKQKYPEARMVFGIIMGTGVGGGIVLDGKVWNGHHGIAGEWGHNFLDESRGACYCGKTGCVETIISGPALEKYYTGITGNTIALKEIIARRDSDNVARKTIQRLHYNFGKAISVVINILDPDVIVIGGGLGNIDSLYSESQQFLKQLIFNNGIDVPIVKPMLGDSAGVFGAAALVA